MKSFCNFFLASLLCLSFFACDPALEHSRVLQNDSEFELWLVKDSASVRDSSLLLPGTSETLWNVFQIGTLGEYESCPATAGSIDPINFYLHVNGNQSLEVHVDLQESEGWVYSILSRGGFGSGASECRRLIRNDDIQ